MLPPRQSVDRFLLAVPTTPAGRFLCHPVGSANNTSRSLLCHPVGSANKTSRSLFMPSLLAAPTKPAGRFSCHPAGSANKSGGSLFMSSCWQCQQNQRVAFLPSCWQCQQNQRVAFYAILLAVPTNPAGRFSCHPVGSANKIRSLPFRLLEPPTPRATDSAIQTTGAPSTKSDHFCHSDYRRASSTAKSRRVIPLSLISHRPF